MQELTKEFTEIIKKISQKEENGSPLDSEEKKALFLFSLLQESGNLNYSQRINHDKSENK